VRGFHFSVYSLRLRKQKQKASANDKVKNRRRASPGYIKARARSTQDFARTLREFQTRRQNVFSVPRTTRARTTDAPRIARPVALTPWRGTRHLWQVKRAPFRLRHDDRLKKGAPHCLNLYPIFLSLSLSLSLLPHGSGKGIFRKDPSQRRKLALSPPTDQGCEGCALWGSATAPEHSGPEPFTDQGIEGWPLGRVRRPPQSMQSER
jgi:hypothetical protein